MMSHKLSFAVLAWLCVSFVIASSGPRTDGKCVSIAASVHDSWCERNCRHNPPHCPVTLCKCLPGSSTTTSTSVTSTSTNPTTTFFQKTRNCKAVSASTVDSWCNLNCNYNPKYCPSYLCECTDLPTTDTSTTTTTTPTTTTTTTVPTTTTTTTTVPTTTTTTVPTTTTTTVPTTTTTTVPTTTTTTVPTTTTTTVPTTTLEANNMPLNVTTEKQAP